MYLFWSRIVYAIVLLTLFCVCRPHHTSLNRFITSRLPLCLPPNTNTPEIYAAGIEHFGGIFLTFEDVWDNLVAGTGLEDTWDSLDHLAASTSSTADERMIAFLRGLRPGGLARTGRLLRDIEVLNRGNGTAGRETAEMMRGQALAEFMSHIREAVKEKPHLLLAYAWTMYMAVFSGGRWIRSQLCQQGVEFWSGAPAQPTNTTTDEAGKLQVQDMAVFEPLGLSFWFFPGSQDGEDIKATFKQRLQDGEDILTPEQRADIVAEAQEIFTRCDALVRELDAMHPEPIRKPGHEIAAGRSKSNLDDSWLGMQGYAGLALVVSCVSWYAMYHAGTWSV
jgi:heme oxygenase